MKNTSFRDPDGFVFAKNGVFYRQVNECYRDAFATLMRSGLFRLLTSRKMLIEHTDAAISLAAEASTAYKIIRPYPLPHISYPYEWCFEQYRNAALLTLDVQLAALEFDMILKDATAYNIQYRGVSPVHIDTTSFACYQDGQAWEAYGQFCRHFLAPLLLLSVVDPSLARLMQLHLDGVPLPITASLLRGKRIFDLPSFIHLFLPARQHTIIRRMEQKVRGTKFPKAWLSAIARNLRNYIARMKPPRTHSPWAEYYKTLQRYGEKGLSQKLAIVKKFLSMTNAKKICDLGANTGTFSLAASEMDSAYVVSYDIDHDVIHRCYNRLVDSRIDNILPLVMDVANASPAIGWELEERMSFNTRADFDCVLALALCHHLTISQNISFDALASYFSRIGRFLITEFVPKHDPRVREMLLHRKDIFNHYDQEHFESAFNKYFKLMVREKIAESERTIYLFSRVSSAPKRLRNT